MASEYASNELRNIRLKMNDAARSKHGGGHEGHGGHGGHGGAGEGAGGVGGGDGGGGGSGSGRGGGVGEKGGEPRDPLLILLVEGLDREVMTRKTRASRDWDSNRPQHVIFNGRGAKDGGSPFHDMMELFIVELIMRHRVLVKQTTTASQTQTFARVLYHKCRDYGQDGAGYGDGDDGDGGGRGGGGSGGHNSDENSGGGYSGGGGEAGGSASVPASRVPSFGTSPEDGDGGGGSSSGGGSGDSSRNSAGVISVLDNSVISLPDSSVNFSVNQSVNQSVITVLDDSGEMEGAGEGAGGNAGENAEENAGDAGEMSIVDLTDSQSQQEMW